MIEICTNKNEYVAACKKYKVGLNQTWEWGETRKNYEKVRLLQGGFPLTIYIRSVLKGSIKFGYMPRCFSEDYVNQKNLNELVEYCRKFDLASLIVEPQIESNERVAQELQAVGFKNSGVTVQPQQTRIVDLPPDIDSLFSEVKPKRRRDIRKARKDGLVVKVDNSKKGLKDFISVMDYLTESKNFSMHNSGYFEAIYNQYSGNPNFNIFLAEKDGELHGSMLTISSGGTTYELYGGVNALGSKMRSNFLLKWTTIESAKEKGDNAYDHWGVANVLENGEFDESHSLYNISKFKEVFGGRTVKFMSQHTFVYKSLHHRVFSTGMSLHKTMIKLRNK